MLNITKFSISLLALILILGIGIVLAQEETSTVDVAEEISLDEDIQAEDLEISEPNILPDSPFYFLKNWGRGIQSFFTFNPVKKTELKLKFANEKLIEAKKLVEGNKKPEIIKKALENYQNEIDGIKTAAEKIKEKAADSPQVSTFLDKFTKHQILHHRILQKLETQVPLELFEKISEIRERHLKRFGEVMIKLEDRKEQLQERLEKSLAEIKGSKFKSFKNLEILLELEEKVPEAAKEAIRGAQENSLKRLAGDLEKMSSENQERFKEYIERIGGVKEVQVEILENLKEELKAKPILRENLIQARETILNQIKERVIYRNCPEIEKPAPDFCKEGRIIMKKDDAGCILSFGCVIAAEIEILPKPENSQACISLWDPVCGKNGKTYSNTCFAKLAGVEIAHKEKCKEIECKTDADCPQLRCGPMGTISARCINLKAKCLEGKCQTISTISTENPLIK